MKLLPCSVPDKRAPIFFPIKKRFLSIELPVEPLIRKDSLTVVWRFRPARVRIHRVTWIIFFLESLLHSTVCRLMKKSNHVVLDTGEFHHSKNKKIRISYTWELFGRLGKERLGKTWKFFCSLSFTIRLSGTYFQQGWENRSLSDKRNILERTFLKKLFLFFWTLSGKKILKFEGNATGSFVDTALNVFGKTFAQKNFLQKLRKV